MTGDPLVTVNILSFNRKDCLKITLEKVFGQDYKNIEVIVVDNASSDGTVEMIEKEYPDVRLIKLQKNIGIAGWNQGFKVAKGEYVLVLDDDSYPDNGVIQEGLNLFFHFNRLGVVGFKIYNYSLQLYENYEFNFCKTGWIESTGFIGCGALISKQYFLQVNGYNKNLFLYFNEYDLSARLLNIGIKTIFFADKIIFHSYSSFNRNMREPSNRLNKRRYYHCFRSYFIFLISNFSFPRNCIFAAKLILSNLFVALHFGFMKDFVKILTEIPSMLKILIPNRITLSKQVQKIYKYGNFKFYDIKIYN